MNTKKVGLSVLLIGVGLLVVFSLSYRDLAQKSDQLGCFDSEGCKPIQPLFSLVNVGFGFFGFIFALGIYLLVFAQGEKTILGILKKEKEKLTAEEKFSILLMGLDEFEQDVLKQVQRQNGVTQSTLRLRVDMSKGKLSQILSGLEKKKLIKREPHKKTLAVYSALDFRA